MSRSTEIPAKKAVNDIYVAQNSSISKASSSLSAAKNFSEPRNRDDKNIEAAVYNYIKAMRALGNTKLNTVAIAKSLGLRTSVVDKAVKNLGGKGIKILA